MTLEKTFIPYGAYFSSPFCRWQGALAGESSLAVVARTTAAFLSARQMSAELLDSIVLGYTVPQKQCFYGAPWIAALIGAPTITGPMIAQACATSARVLSVAAAEVEAGQRSCTVAVTCDRTSNGPHIYYPNPRGIGGMGETEDPVWDNFNRDPWAKGAMIETAENVARQADISRATQEEISLLRYQQYEQALADDRAFQRRYMFPVQVGKGKKAKTVDADEGIHPTTAEGLAKLAPVIEGGTVTFGAQTHPADGNAAMIVCNEERARELSRDPKISVRLRGFGEARVEKGFMPKAVVPAARAALERAGIELSQCKAIKTHNPFAVNDAYFCKEMGLAFDQLNRFGSPLVFGHPQGPTGMRLCIELIEELVQAGGGFGLFSGCAAGDTAMALVLEVS